MPMSLFSRAEHQAVGIDRVKATPPLPTPPVHSPRLTAPVAGAPHDQ